jgi:hypothetical protein
MQQLVDAFTASVRIAERKLLLATGFQNLPDLGWEWDVLAKVEAQYKLRQRPKWVAQEPQAQVHVDPTDIRACFQPLQQLSGRQVAEQFLINRCLPWHVYPENAWQQ